MSAAYIYAMRRASDGAIKIGRSANPKARCVAVSAEHGKCELLYARGVSANQVELVERVAHQLAVSEMIRGEFFRFADVSAAIAVIERAAESVAAGIEIDYSDACRKRARIGLGLPLDGSGTVRVITPMAQELVDRINEFRLKYRIPSFAEAVRLLVREGLANPEVAARDYWERAA